MDHSVYITFALAGLQCTTLRERLSQTRREERLPSPQPTPLPSPATRSIRKHALPAASFALRSNHPPSTYTHSAVAASRPTSGIRPLPSRPQIHTPRPSRRTSSHASPLTSLLNRQLLRDRRKQLLHILRRLRRRLEEEQVGFSRVGFGVGSLDGAFVGFGGDEIEFVACECDDDVFVCLALEFFYPGFGFV